MGPTPRLSSEWVSLSDNQEVNFEDTTVYRPCCTSAPCMGTLTALKVAPNSRKLHPRPLVLTSSTNAPQFILKFSCIKFNRMYPRRYMHPISQQDYKYITRRRGKAEDDAYASGMRIRVNVVQRRHQLFSPDILIDSSMEDVYVPFRKASTSFLRFVRFSRVSSLRNTQHCAQT